MSTIEDFENAPIGATATRDKGARVMKTGDVGRNWVSPGGSHLDNKEMVYWGYTLDPFPAPTTAREALDLAWELAHPVNTRQVLPEGTACLYRLDDGYQIQETPEGMIARESWTDIRTLDPIPDPEPDWRAAPAVIAHTNNNDDRHVWVSLRDDQWTSLGHTFTRHWSSLRDVTPLYPEGKKA